MSERALAGPARRVIVLGSTGSIGVNTLRVLHHLNRLHPKRQAFEVVGLAAGGDLSTLREQVATWGGASTALARGADGDATWTGPEASLRLVENVEADLVVAAIVGIAGLRPTFRAVELGRDVALANKECLVAAGELLMAAARERGVRLTPVDSEHAAIAQALRGRHPDTIRRVLLTASGGAFRDVPPEQLAELEDATPDQALAHPTWDMGPKVTIDSATLMNKVLELIEAHHLFGVGSDRLGALLHPDSRVHGLIELRDGSVLLQLAEPDMQLPIQQALLPQELADTLPGLGPLVDWDRPQSLDFRPIDPDRYPAIRLAEPVIDGGGTRGVVLNAANEAAVAGFLCGRSRFGDIVHRVSETLYGYRHGSLESVDHALAVHREVVESMKH